MEREDVRFRSGDDECAAWVYRPEAADGADVACVVMAHGFGGVKEARLDAYAERFAAAGYAALVFDYRYHGASGGEPRLLIDVGRQHADWRAAIAYARRLDGVDPGRIALWGSSFSGGHVLELAAAGEPVVAAIAQAPFMDGIATLRSAGAADNVRMSVAALRDVAGALLGRPPRLMPVVAPPGQLAAMNSPDAEPGYLALIPPGYDWPNRFIPRATLSLPRYRPVKKAAKVPVPLLVQVMTDDAVTPPEPARKAAAMAPQGELIEYPGGHFDVYVGEPFERAVGDQIAFLQRVL
jgi:dienelactone hydrolase